MNRRISILVAAAAALVLAGASAPARDRGGLMPLPAVLERIAERYVGEVIDIEVDADDDDDDIVYQVRLLTERGNVIRIEIDAVTGAFLEVDGHGFIEALRP